MDCCKDGSTDYDRPPSPDVTPKHPKNIASKNQLFRDRCDDNRGENQQEPVLQIRILGQEPKQRLRLSVGAHKVEAQRMDKIDRRQSGHQPPASRPKILPPAGFAQTE